MLPVYPRAKFLILKDLKKRHYEINIYLSYKTKKNHQINVYHIDKNELLSNKKN